MLLNNDECIENYNNFYHKPIIFVRFFFSDTYHEEELNSIGNCKNVRFIIEIVVRSILKKNYLINAEIIF